MRKNNHVTGRELDYSKEQRIVSTTDLKGKLTYVNSDFIDIAGYAEEELINHGHNIVRHPDMPPAAFADLWKTIKAGKSWMGVVNNRCKNGDNYWVDAFVTPMMENNKVIGYQSVRLKPEKSLVAKAEAFYKTLWKPASAWAKLKKLLSFNLAGKISLVSFGATLMGLLTLLSMGHTLDGTLLTALAVMAGSGMALSQWVARPWQQAARDAKAIFDNDVALKVYTDRSDELGQLQLVIKMQQSELETVVWRISDASSNLEKTSHSASRATEQTTSSLHQQSREVEQVATAMNEMTATVKEVAHNAQATFTSTEQAATEVTQGKQIVTNTIEGIGQLNAEVEKAVGVIDTLSDNTQQIGTVVDEIKSIADQTNLLALNAAIEAARAGELGRGFAVVAAEVRALAGRTQASTEEIQTMVETFRESANDAVIVMQRGQELAQQSSNQAEMAGTSLESISNAVYTISDMNRQIATAAEEQTAVSEEINRNVINIDTATTSILEASETSHEANNVLTSSTIRLTAMASQFGS